MMMMMNKELCDVKNVNALLEKLTRVEFVDTVEEE
jgi:hypothetical protein